ncbi:saccharopine dehydrogenase NADP-binding domain-containing protein [Saccharopolyspora sp. HNM0983]|uniref:Saccharopine dehydrogenase NADP-binding domain-containing protein n=1 Tax=Saccharopolyspora montiporae TaxID=2781240 RepID=A0A929B473_9PSEU|nr:saccharopine dehydrogenase NADP-binding domain-containing protein [Saccharopolyspora sp. HNM0983]MBE9372854.1 saccharopine dehydrogenase NADP-binding domain-containing protein [Saccharopolyspora sp. HNM0983]
MAGERAHDLVVFGATGFTGKLTAEYLARHAPAECRWALAGRNADKLRAVRTALAEINPACADLPLVHADTTDPASMQELAAGARVVITTVGPYTQYGDPLVAACADNGTDYVDLAGEPEFVDRMYLRHHERAATSGARIVHACGFDSIPHDLGVLHTVSRLPAREPVRVEGFVRVGGRFSGGTYASALTAFSRASTMARTAKERRRAEPKPQGRKVRTHTGRAKLSSPVHAWSLPLPTIDPQVVTRSAAASTAYGPEFTYGHYAAVKRLPVAIAGVAGLGVLALAAQITPVRKWLQNRLEPGSGPSAERRAQSWFTVRFIGREGDRTVITEVSGGDPGYDETATMLAESALSLAFDDLPEVSGQVTPATAMGSALTERLVGAGMRFAVLDRTPTSPPHRVTT